MSNERVSKVNLTELGRSRVKIQCGFKFQILVIIAFFVKMLSGFGSFRESYSSFKDYVNICSVRHVLPASWVAKVSLAENNSIERCRELEVDNHSRLFTGDIQPSYLRHIIGLLSPGSYRLKLTFYPLKIVEIGIK